MVCRCIYGMCTSSEVFWLDHMVLFLVFWEASVMSLTVGAPMNTLQQFKASLPHILTSVSSCSSTVILMRVRWTPHVVLVCDSFLAEAGEYFSLYLLAVCGSLGTSSSGHCPFSRDYMLCYIF